MKKNLVVTVLFVFVALTVFAQKESVSLSDPDPKQVGVDSARQALKEVSVDLFEREASWNVKMSTDDGVISARLFDGGSASKDPLPEGVPAEQLDAKVLGVKVEFFHRGFNTFFVNAVRPLPIEGVSKVVSVWVAGRNYDHSLTLLVQDYFGSSFELYVGKLNFSGWKKMSVAIPPSPDGRRGIVQFNSHYGERPGLRIVGFKIDCNPEEAFGTYYVYFDDLRVVTDLYAVENRDKDDMSDNW